MAVAKASTFAWGSTVSATTTVVVPSDIVTWPAVDNSEAEISVS